MSVYTLIRDFVFEVCDRFGNVLRYTTQIPIRNPEEQDVRNILVPQVRNRERGSNEQGTETEIEIEMSGVDPGSSTNTTATTTVATLPHSSSTQHRRTAVNHDPTPTDKYLFIIRSVLAFSALTIESYLCHFTSVELKNYTDEMKKRRKIRTIFLSVITLSITVIDVGILCYQQRRKTECRRICLCCCIKCKYDIESGRSLFDPMGILVILCSIMSLLFVVGDYVSFLHNLDLVLFNLNILPPIMAFMVLFTLVVSESGKYWRC